MSHLSGFENLVQETKAAGFSIMKERFTVTNIPITAIAIQVVSANSKETE